MEKFDIFDTYTHPNTDDFAERKAEELAFVKETGVVRHNAVGFDAPTIKRAIELAEKSPETYATTGWHPVEVGSYNQEIEDMIVTSLSHPKMTGLGKIGLDYHWMEDPKDVQMEVFKRQVQLPKDHNLPFIVHTRNTFEDAYAVIKEAGVGPRGGTTHSFSGSSEMTERFIELDMMILFPGVVTFKRTLDAQEATQRLLLDKILVETDTPYLTSVPKRGRENRAVYIRYITDKIAEFRGLTGEKVARVTSDNAKRLFNCD